MGTHHTTKYYRCIFLSDLSVYICKSYEENKVKDMIIIGDINEHIEEKMIVHFMNENGLVDSHKQINGLGSKVLDNTFKYGLKCIDVVICTYGLIEFISGC